MREEGRTENTSRRWHAHVPRQPRRRGRRWPRRRRRAPPPAPRNPLADRREGRRVAVGAPKRRHSPGGRAAELTLLPTADDATHLSHPHTASLSRGGERRGSTYDTYSTVHQHLVHICEWSHADRKRTGGEQHHHHVCAQGLSCHGRSRQPRRRSRPPQEVWEQLKPAGGPVRCGDPAAATSRGGCGPAPPSQWTTLQTLRCHWVEGGTVKA